MRIESNVTYPRPIKVDILKESYRVVKDYHRREEYNMTQKEYRKWFFAGANTLKTIMRILECPHGSEIRIIDGAEDNTKRWNRHLVADRFFTGKQFRVGLWVYSDGEFNLVIKDLNNGERTYKVLHSANTKEMVKTAYMIKREYFK